MPFSNNVKHLTGIFQTILMDHIGRKAFTPAFDHGKAPADDPSIAAEAALARPCQVYSGSSAPQLRILSSPLRHVLSHHPGHPLLTPPSPCRPPGGRALTVPAHRRAGETPRSPPPPVLSSRPLHAIPPPEGLSIEIAPIEDLILEKRPKWSIPSPPG